MISVTKCGTYVQYYFQDVRGVCFLVANEFNVKTLTVDDVAPQLDLIFTLHFMGSLCVCFDYNMDISII